MNRFLEWIGLKQKLHQGTQSPPLVSHGDIWWASIGENVGSEINGKSRLFSRPVIIFKKLAHGFYFVIPTTTKSKVGSWYVSVRQADREMIASLHQARATVVRLRGVDAQDKAGEEPEREGPAAKPGDRVRLVERQAGSSMPQAAKGCPLPPAWFLSKRES